MDLNGLTKLQKLQLLDVLEEQRRRQRDKQVMYVPNTGQMPVHASRVRDRYVFSGNGAGKTTLAANEAVWAAQGFNPVTQEFTPVPCRVVVIVDHPQKSDDVWVPEIQKWFNIRADQLQKRGSHSVTRIAFPNGSEIVFFSHAMDPMMFESIEVDFIVADEPPPRHVFIALTRGGRRKHRQLRILVVGTPISGRWLRQEVWEPWSKGQLKEVECFKYGTKVNEQNLADGYIDSFSARLTEKERRMRLEGEFHDLDGLALAHLLDRDIHVVKGIEQDEWDTGAPCVVAIDPHPVKEHHAVVLGVDKEGFLYYLGEMSKKLPARQFARCLHDFMRPYRVVDVVVDCLGSQEGTGGEGFKSFIQVLKEEGIAARPTTWDDKQDEDFIERIRDVLLIPDAPDNFGNRVPKLRFIEGRSSGILSDIENVQWTKSRLGQPGHEYKPKLDISNKDFLSCLKYALAANLTPSKGKAKMFVLSSTQDGTIKKPQRARVQKLRPHRSNAPKKGSAMDDWRDW